VSTTLPPDHDEFRADTDDSATTEASVDRLFRESEIEAEYTIGWVRIAAGFILFASGLGLSSGIGSQSMAEGVHITGLITVGAFLLLGITSLLLVVRGWFKPSIAFVFVAGDAIILTTSLFVALKTSGLRGNEIAAMPVIWGIPVVIAVGALRYRPDVQLWFTAIMIAGLVRAAAALGSPKRGPSLRSQPSAAVPAPCRRPVPRRSRRCGTTRRSAGEAPSRPFDFSRPPRRAPWSASRSGAFK
jgi:hypothetical protein